MPVIIYIHFVKETIFEYSGCWTFVPCQNIIQLIGSIERIFGNIPEQILHRSHKRDQLLHSSKTNLLNHMQVVNVSL